ncbi:MAG TPA: tetratricopeptide repeat protein [Edaphobacter sp.]
MLTCMNILRWLFSHLLLIALTTALLGGHECHAQFTGAYERYARGDPRGAIAALKEQLEGSSDELSGVERGVAWNLLGSAYQTIEEFQEARRCYENSLRILREIANARLDYAAALMNMASLELTVGDIAAAKAMQLKLRQLYGTDAYHSGLARVANDLALIDLTEKNVRGARRETEEAFREAALAGTLSDDDYAPMYVLDGSVTEAEGDPHGAIAAYNKAIELWTRGHGPRYYMLITAYGLRAGAREAIGETAEGIADVKAALALTEQISGRDSIAYYSAELRYAKLLRKQGEKQEAARMEKVARDGIAALSRKQCNGCTISAESFR